MKTSSVISMCFFSYLLVACGGGGAEINQPSVSPSIVQTLKENNSILGLQEPYSLVSMAPSVIQIATHPISQDPRKIYASQLFFDLDSELNLIDVEGEKASSLQNFLNNSQGKFLIVARVRDQKTIQALEVLSKTMNLNDLAVIANDSDLLNLIHTKLPLLRSGLDLRKEVYLTNQSRDLLEIVKKTNQSFARFVILPKQLNSKANVSFIQKLLVSVWVECDNSPLDAATALVTGANGIITNDSKNLNQILQQFPTNTLLRKPLIIGHRGVPSLEDENTLESAKHAVTLGANAVENDVFITKDNHLVVMHDGTVNRTTNGNGAIENMTLAEVKQLSTKNRGYKIPTLEEYFQEFKTNKKVVHFIELKSTNPLIVPQLKQEIDKYAVDDQVVTISFYPEQISRVKSLLPSISTGYLANTPNFVDQKDNLNKILEITQSLSVTFNPSYADNLIQLMEAAKHRSITVWPWTINDENQFKKLYVSGVYGITTNYSQYASKYIVDIQTQPHLVVEKDKKLKLNVQLTTQDENRSTALASSYIILNGSPKYEIENGTIKFKESGVAYALLGYKHQIDAQSYYQIFSEPVRIVIE